MNLERSTLERKDRAELATIAETLGRKPASRAKKSDIIDLILDLTGVTATNGEPETESPGTNGQAKTRTETADAPTEPDAAEVATDEAAAVDSDAGTSVTPVADSASDSDEQHDDPPAESVSTDSDSQQNTGSAAGGEGAEDGQWADGESGNRRRRRRRGRERDRQGEPGDDQVRWEGEPVDVEGLLDLRDEGYGFLRVKGFLPSRDDVYVSVKQVRQLGLRKGDHVKGAGRPAGRQEKNPALLRVDEVNGMEPDVARRRPRFEDLTPLFPDEKLRLETSANPGDMTSRIIDLIAPIGKGQRGLIVSPPKAGKTTIMKSIATSIEANNPDVMLIMLLVDERPEEVTDIRRSVKGEVVASTFDRPAEEHTMVAELTIERAKRLVEYGQDVVIILDG
ncbi:MAG TPA: transcription termination factor Rho, partial [Microthrixaceae bacterium]|nr:transcription termination factor Rho [Microthrixaceae bacterium]